MKLADLLDPEITENVDRQGRPNLLTLLEFVFWRNASNVAEKIHDDSHFWEGIIVEVETVTTEMPGEK